jgi:hypothetical protein
MRGQHVETLEESPVHELLRLLRPQGKAKDLVKEASERRLEFPAVLAEQVLRRVALGIEIDDENASAGTGADRG